MVQLKSGAHLAARWDKLKSVNLLADEINSKIKSLDVDEAPITLDIGPQLMHTLRHPSSLRCLDHSSSKLGETFTTHCNKGALQMVKMWTLKTKDRNGVIKQKTFETNCEITSMTFVSKHRVYMVFCSDLTLRVFTDSNSNFVEVQCIEYLTTILCLVYNKEEDEVYAGGIGFIEEWKIQGAEHAALAIPGRKFVTELTRNEWIRDIQVDEHKRQMFAVHGNGICVINMKTRQQVRKLPNRHDGPLKCCCYYYPSDFLITGGSDGKLKLFNGTAFNMLHILSGHHGPITSVLPHKTDTLLFSASFDGSVRIWRMESLQMFMRLDMGEKIYHLSLIGSTEFFFGTEKNILIYNLNQFYQMFAPVESETKKLMRCTGRGKCSRILGSTEDGSVRLFSPVTGLTLTMVYPMPSFQVLMSFAYDMHQDKLHVVLTGGKVLVFDTSTNPCTVEELWETTSDDEKVNHLLLVTLEFTCKDGGLDIDNLVFAGLENGQIILCESVVCSLQHPVQAHEGNIVCLEKCFQMTSRNFGLLDTTNMIISGGTDNFIKIWFIDVNTENHRPFVNMVQTMKIYLVSVPTHISMFGCHLCVVIKACTELGVRWSLVMYQMVSMDSDTKVDKQVCNLLNMATWVPYQLTHSPDEDHSKEITALDVCPLMGTILTAGQDGFVKVWSNKNELLKEMNFVSPIYASCFANDRGDILVGYGAHVCSVSVVNYLPASYLSKVLYIAQISRLLDDKRELPVAFDHNCQPRVDLSNVKKYSINIFERRRQHLEEDVIKRLKKEKEATKFVIFSEGGTTKVIAKDLADKLLFWAKGKHKLQIGKKAWTEFTSLSDIRSTEDHKITVAEKKKSESKKNAGSITLIDEPEEKEFFDSEGLIEIYPSAVGKALLRLEAKPKRGLTAEEMRLLSEAELLKKDPIIAPDGYIPNSVIRRKLKPPQIDPPIRFDRPFKLKPIPKINPHHLPSWWGKEEEEEDRGATTPVRFRAMKWEDSPSPVSDISMVSRVSTVSIKSLIDSPVKKYIEDKSKTTSPKSALSKEKSGRKSSRNQSRSDKTPVENMQKIIKLNEKYGKKKSGWEDSSSSEKPDTTLGLSQPSTVRDAVQPSPTDSPARLTSGMRYNSGIPYSPYQSGSAHSRISSTESVRSKKMNFHKVDLRMSTPDGRKSKSGRKSVERTKSFTLTNLAVDEDSSAIHVKDSKSGRRQGSNMESDIIQRLLGEKWMPKMEGEYKYEDVLDALIGTLDNNNPVVFDNVCEYLRNIFKELGIPDAQLEKALTKLGMNLNNVNSALKKYTLQTLQVLGEGRKDIILLILPKLVDPEEPIRKAAAEAIALLTGAQDKDALFAVLDEMGLTSGIYSSKEDEAKALQMLAERFNNKEDESQHFDRIQGWVLETTPGFYEDEVKDEDASGRDGKQSRKNTKELSSLSGKSGFMSDGKSVIDIFDNSGQSGRNTMYADLPPTPLFSSDDELGFESRGVSMTEAKSADQGYMARMALMDRAGASVLPGERFEISTPVSDVDDDFFNRYPLEDVPEGHGTRPTSQRSHDLLGERTLTDLSQVGPLPKFMSSDLAKQNTDNISTDSAFESTFSSLNEYTETHFSEKYTMSHLDQQSSKRSEVSDETNNMFDVEQVSTLEYEGDDDLSVKIVRPSDEINRMNKYGDVLLTLDSNHNSMISEESDVYPHQISIEITPRDSGRKDTNQDTPRSGSTLKKRFNEMDGFSTISDRSSLSRKSKRGSSRTASKLTQHTLDGDADIEDETLSELALSVKIRTPISQESVADECSCTQPQPQNPDAVSLRDILAYKSDEESSSFGDRRTPSAGEQNAANIDEGVSIRPETADKDREELTESQLAKELTSTDTTETTDPNRDVYDALTIDLLAQQNAQYPSESPEPNHEPEQDNLSHKPEETEIENKEGLNLPLEELQDEQKGSSDGVSPRFTPRDPHLYNYYNHQKGQSPRGTTHVDTREDDGSEDKMSGNRLGEKDSDFHSISNVASSQISDRLSGYDSGIARDMSEYSQGRSGAGFGPIKEHGTEKGYTYGAPLSPVKSETSSKGRHSARSLHASHSKGSHSARAANKGHGKGSRSARSADNDSTEWRKFFDQLPNVMERRQMEQIKKEMEQGKLKAAVLPPVSYFADDIPMLPGEAGTRLLQKVQVGKKLPHPSDCKYQIESVPGKLAMHTKNGGGGLSRFGILEMKWTTGRPTMRDKLEPPQLIAPYRSIESKLQPPELMAPYRSPESKLQEHYLLSMSGHHRVKNDVLEEELNLPQLSAGSAHASNGPSPNHYEWELPLPPPPAKESRTNIPHIKKAHDSYCKYYELVKKKLHLYTSKLGFIPALIAAEKARPTPQQERERSSHLPEVLVKRIREEPTENTGSPGKLLSPSKTALGSQLFLPPIKLGQLVKMY